MIDVDRNGNVLLTVHVQPGARRSEVVGRHGDALKVRVAAPPTDGKANRAVLDLIAGTLGVPAGDVELVGGASSRRKRIKVTGTSADVVSQRLRGASSIPTGNTGGGPTMTALKPFTIEVRVEAPHDRVWAALTEPREIRRWHGWDDVGLDDEIQFIYVDHATPAPPDRIELVEGEDRQTIELVPDGTSTVVRISRPGPAPADDRYDVIEEGWRSFFEQMRHYLERHPGEERRTIFLQGKAGASDVTGALAAKLPGWPYFGSTFQRGIATEDFGGGLVVLSAQEPLDSDRPGTVHLTLTTHGLDDGTFATVHDDWWTWWSSQVDTPQSTVT